MRALKIKKVDDKPMVIHTKEKAKIHSHEPKGARIKGSERASFSRSTKMQLAKYLASYVDKHSDKFIVAEKVKGTINKYKKVM